MFVGMPASMHLDEFASHVWSVFGTRPYLVGSAAKGKVWRDVDVRLILDDEVYEKWELGDPSFTNHSARWTALCMAFSALGAKMTGLPIDFQIQQFTRANELYKEGPRHPLGMVPWRYALFEANMALKDATAAHQEEQ